MNDKELEYEIRITALIHLGRGLIKALEASGHLYKRPDDLLAEDVCPNCAQIAKFLDLEEHITGITEGQRETLRQALAKSKGVSNA